MSLNIKNPETERLVRTLVEETGESVTDAVTVAVRERLVRVRRDGPEGRLRRIQEIASDSNRRWLDEYRTVDHGDLLYDERGLPH